MSYLSSEQIAQIEEARAEIRPRFERLLLAVSHYQYSSEQAAEYARHGYLRRIGTLRRCIENVFELIPPAATEIPDRNTLHDAQINIQAFFANVYGCIDNLAWMWVYEKGLSKIARSRVGLRSKHTEVRSTFSVAFQSFLHELDPWLEYLIEYRDALAHRIPLYIPPGGVLPKYVEDYNAISEKMTKALYADFDGFQYERLSDQQEKFLVFQPLITHSVNETTAHFAFHVQMPTDFLTVEELGYKILAELKNRG